MRSFLYHPFTSHHPYQVCRLGDQDLQEAAAHYYPLKPHGAGGIRSWFPPGHPHELGLVIQVFFFYPVFAHLPCICLLVHAEVPLFNFFTLALSWLLSHRNQEASRLCSGLREALERP